MEIVFQTNLTNRACEFGFRGLNKSGDFPYKWIVVKLVDLLKIRSELRGIVIRK